jgi:hypothetical protein
MTHLTYYSPKRKPKSAFIERGASNEIMNTVVGSSIKGNLSTFLSLGGTP